MLWAVATARPEVGAAELEAAVRETLEALRDEGPGGDEVRGARNRARRSLVGQLNSVGRRADAFAHAAVLRDDPDYVNRVFERYDAVGREDVAGLARRVLQPDDLTVVRVVPEGSAETEEAA